MRHPVSCILWVKEEIEEACPIAAHSSRAAVPLIGATAVTEPVLTWALNKISVCNPEARARIEGFLHHERRILNSPVILRFSIVDT